MRLIVFGPTGGTGLALVEQASAAGHQVTAFARRPALLGAAASRPGVNVITGDALDPDAVAAAIAGHDVVLSALGTRPWRHVDICSRGIAAIVPAMVTAGVRRIIALSSLGVAESWSQMGAASRAMAWLFLRKAFRDKAVMEQLLRESDRDWIAVRPGLLTSGKPRGTWRVADDGSLSGGRIARADVAAFMLQQLTSDTWLRKLPVVVGGRPAY